MRDETMQSPTSSVVSAPTPRSRSIALSRRLLGPIWLRVGLTAVLIVQGRRTGKPHQVSLFPVVVDGTTYLLSQYGVSAWVRNLRAAGHAELQRKGSTTPFAAIEVDGGERDGVIAAFRAKTPKQFTRDFDQLPTNDDHPTFRVEPA
jgi:deazaflavin-dependent oxidoreductase (nitroreductase family)